MNSESDRTSIEKDDLLKYSKEELIAKVKSLVAHNTQLKNIIAKNSDSGNKLKEREPAKSFDFSKCQFKHIALKIMYLGWDYKGFVIQEDTPDTIEFHLFEALTKTKLIKDRNTSNYHRCGRTDKGVSSFGQVISIDMRSNLSDKDDEEINYCKILNRVLPNNIQCLAWSTIDQNFSARFDCLSRTYRYYFPRGNLLIEEMEMAYPKLLGVHDFRNFCKMDVGNGVLNYVRHIFSINIRQVSKDYDEFSIFVLEIKAKAFLWHQIRCIMGILFLIGQGKEKPDVIDELLNVEKNPRKPDYAMANEVPLNLFDCEYENLDWNYDEEAMKETLNKLSSIWTIAAIKEAMLKEMLRNLNIINGCSEKMESCFSNNLLNRAKPKKYISLMNRPQCNSLEDKIEHFSKRRKNK